MKVLAFFYFGLLYKKYLVLGWAWAGLFLPVARWHTANLSLWYGAFVLVDGAFVAPRALLGLNKLFVPHSYSAAS